MAQVADGPPGFANCLKLTTTTADTSIAAGEHLLLSQNIEGQDLQQLKKGTASAEQVTVSFWVKGNAAALYVCEIQDTDTVGGRVNTQSFAVTTSWNRIELTFAADTTGALDDDNATSLALNFWLHAGATFTGGTFAGDNTWAGITQANRAAVDGFTSIYDATSRTFFLTGVQMEIGATATEFESSTFGEELALCQRYLPAFNGAFNNSSFGIIASTTTINVVWNFPVPARTELTGIYVADVSHFNCGDTVASNQVVTGVAFANAGLNSGFVVVTSAGGSLAATRPGVMWGNTGAAQILFTGAEL